LLFWFSSFSLTVLLSFSFLYKHNNIANLGFLFVIMKPDTWKHTALLAFQSLGVVFGHLSIGPLFVLHTAAPDEIQSEEMLYGLMSFIFWTMTFIPLVKYAFIVLRADDNREGNFSWGTKSLSLIKIRITKKSNNYNRTTIAGGTFALYSLLCRHAKVGLLPSNQIEDELCLYKDSGEPKAQNAIDKNKKSRYLMWFMAMLGSCMVIANGILVPVISGLEILCRH